MVPSSVSRHPEINFFGPQESSYLSLWTISERKDTQTVTHVVFCKFTKATKRVSGFWFWMVLGADEAAVANSAAPAAFQTSYDTRAAEAKRFEQRYDACDSFF